MIGRVRATKEGVGEVCVVKGEYNGVHVQQRRKGWVNGWGDDWGWVGWEVKEVEGMVDKIWKLICGMM